VVMLAGVQFQSQSDLALAKITQLRHASETRTYSSGNGLLRTQFLVRRVETVVYFRVFSKIYTTHYLPLISS